MSVLLAIMWLGVNLLQPAVAQVADESILVGVKEAPPFAIKNADGSWSGISVDLWRRIAADLGMKYHFRELPLGELLAAVERAEVAVALGALTITADRERQLDFSHAFHSTGLSIAVPLKPARPWLTVMRNFFSGAFLQVVALLLVLVFVIGALVWFLERRKNTAQFGGGAVRGLGAGVWWSAVTMTTVGYGDKAPVTFGGRLVALIWMFAAIIVISSFTAAITSALTVTQLETGISGPDDLPRARVGTLADSTSATYLQDHGITYTVYATVDDGLAALRGKQLDAFVYDAPLLRYVIKQSFGDSLTVLPQVFLRQDYGIALPQRSGLREEINGVLLREISDPQWQDVLERYLGA